MRNTTNLRSRENPTIRQRALTFGVRVLRRARATLGHAQRRCWKTRLLFPIRNRLFGDKPISMRVNGISLRLAPTGAMAAYYWTGPRSGKHQLKFLLQSLQPGHIFFDVGANAGPFAIAAANKIGEPGVYAFEPCEERFQLLRLNLELNGMTRLAAIRSALGNYVGNTVLHAGSGHVEGASRVGGPNHTAGLPARQESVAITTLDAFMEANAIPRMDAMKVSVGGAELLVFQGSRNLLERSDAPLILFEASGTKTSRFGYHPVETLWFLTDRGYSLFILDPDKGTITARRPDGRFDALVVAAKPNHLMGLKL